MIDIAYYDMSREQMLKSDFWTARFYRSAYESIKKSDRFPIVIPSYNRPECLFLKWVHNSLKNSKETWPIYLMVRDSQVEMYKKSPLIKGYNFIHIISRPDNEIDDVGKARKAILDYFFDKTEWVFMLDDDVLEIGFTAPTRRKNSIASGIVPNTNYARLFAMWQKATQVAQKYRKYDLFETSMNAFGFSWMPDNCAPKTSVIYGKGTTGVCTAINISFAKYHGINYKTVKGNGHDDANFVIRCMQNGGVCATFPWITFRFVNGSEKKSEHEIFKDENFFDRFHRQQNEIQATFHNCPFLKCALSKYRKYAVVNIDWRKAIQYHNDICKKYPSLDPKKRVFNLSEEMINGKT